MKVLEESDGRPTIIQLDAEDSAVCFEPDGKMTAFIPKYEDNEIVNAGAWEAALCIMLHANKEFHAMIEKYFENQKKD